MNQKKFDLLIVGAGLSGLLTAYSLSLGGLKIAIIDKSDFSNDKNIRFDFRTTAISEGSKLFFEKIGFWEKIFKHSEPIKKIKVIDRNITNKIEFENPETKSFLGYIVKNDQLKKALIKDLSKRKNVFLYPKSNLKNIENANGFVFAKTDNQLLKSKLLIAADGKNSFVRKMLKTPIFTKKYKHDALVVNLNHEKNHNNIAYEIFHKSGPLAILPMKSYSNKSFFSSIVWSNNSDYFKSLLKIDDNKFKFILEENIKDYIGKIKKINYKKLFSLSAHINSSFYENQIIYIGDAAHSMHPIAGQGWNLGVRDIENLSNVIEEALELGLDIGDRFICKKYSDLSFKNSFMLYQITDKLNNIFLFDDFLSNNIRNIGFELIDKNSRINNFISFFAMGKNKLTTS